MITFFLLVTTLNSISAAYVLAIAALCRIEQKSDPQLQRSVLELYIGCWMICGTYLTAAYFGPTALQFIRHSDPGEIQLKNDCIADTFVHVADLPPVNQRVSRCCDAHFGLPAEMYPF